MRKGGQRPRIQGYVRPVGPAGAKTYWRRRITTVSVIALIAIATMWQYGVFSDSANRVTLPPPAPSAGSIVTRPSNLPTKHAQAHPSPMKPSTSSSLGPGPSPSIVHSLRTNPPSAHPTHKTKSGHPTSPPSGQPTSTAPRA